MINYRQTDTYMHTYIQPYKYKGNESSEINKDTRYIKAKSTVES